MTLKNRHNGRGQDASGETSPQENNLVVGIDLGTTKVCVIIAEHDPNTDSLTILGKTQAVSDGINRGVVTNFEKTVRAIRDAVEQAEQQAGIAIEGVSVGIAGDHIQSFQTTGIISISNPDREITEADVIRLLEETRKIAIPADREIIHVVPQDFIIDGQDGINDPVGMSGIRMEGHVHVVTGGVTAAQNIKRCIERAGLKVDHIVLEPLASSYAVLDEEEREVGVAIVDIGGGTTDIAVFEGGIIRHTSVIGVAGRQVTDDIRKSLGIIYAQAEKIKLEYGHAWEEGILRDDSLMIPGVGGRKPIEITKSLLCQIIQPRMEEILGFVLLELQRSGYADSLSAGVVLTGGGALLRGVEDLAEHVFGMPVKVGIPSGVGLEGLAPEVGNPQFATGVGLIRYALENEPLSLLESTQSGNVVADAGQQTSRSLKDRVMQFFQEL